MNKQRKKKTSRCARILRSSQSRGETQSLRSGIYPCPRGDYILQGLYGHEFIPRSAISIFYLANVSGCLANVLRHPFRLVRHRDRCKDLPMRIALHARDSVSSPHLVEGRIVVTLYIHVCRRFSSMSSVLATIIFNTSIFSRRKIHGEK